MDEASGLQVSPGTVLLVPLSYRCCYLALSYLSTYFLAMILFCVI